MDGRPGDDRGPPFRLAGDARSVAAFDHDSGVGERPRHVPLDALRICLPIRCRCNTGPISIPVRA
jgi:hypothetical protein